MEVVEQAARVGHIPVRRHHRKLRDATAQLAPQLVRPDLRLVDREVRVPWHSRPTPHFRETAPRTRTRCASRARPQPQSGVRRRLVLQQHVQPCRRAAGLAPDHVQQVGFALAQAVVNEADRIEPDARPQQAAMKRVGLRAGWLALVALFFLPPQRSLPRGAGANLLDVASLPPFVTPMFRLPAVEILGDTGMNNLVAQLEVILVYRPACGHGLVLLDLLAQSDTVLGEQVEVKHCAIGLPKARSAAAFTANRNEASMVRPHG